MERIKEKYVKEGIDHMQKTFAYTNKMEVPRLGKIVINVGMGSSGSEAKVLDYTVSDLGKIVGQRPMVTRAKKDIANFKLRKGSPVGCAVTLRKQRMYEFFDRFVNVALPRFKDFNGVSPKGFDGRGNYTLGLNDQTIFAEINYDQAEKVFGMNVTFVTTAKTDKEARVLLEFLGMPFRK